MYVHGNLTC